MPVSPPLRARLLRALVAVGLASGVLLAIEVSTRRSAPAPVAPPGRSAVPPRVEDSRFATLQTAAGPVRVAKTDLARLPREELSAAVERARAAGLQASEAAPWHLQSSTACGWFLRDRTDQVRILPTDVLRRVVVERRDGREERSVLAAAATRVSAELSPDLDPGYRVALETTLRRLSLPDEDPDSTRLNPGYARLILAEGWLERVAPAAHAGARQALEDALAAAMAMRAQALWLGESHELARVADAWGEGGTVFRGLDRTVVVVRPPPPMDDSSRHDALAMCETVIELPSDFDPVAHPAAVAEAERVALLHDGIELVSWSRAEGPHVDRPAWRRVFPERGDDWAEDAFPPHVVLGGLDRSVQGLVVTQGVLRPVADGSAEEAERFHA